METALSPVELCQQYNVPAPLPLTAPSVSAVSAVSATACGTLCASSPFTASATACGALCASSPFTAAGAAYRTLSTAAPFTMAAMSKRRCRHGGSSHGRQPAHKRLQKTSPRLTARG